MTLHWPSREVCFGEGVKKRKIEEVVRRGIYRQHLMTQIRFERPQIKMARMHVHTISFSPTFNKCVSFESRYLTFPLLPPPLFSDNAFIPTGRKEDGEGGREGRCSRFKKNQTEQGKGGREEEVEGRGGRVERKEE